MTGCASVHAHAITERYVRCLCVNGATAEISPSESVKITFTVSAVKCSGFMSLCVGWSVSQGYFSLRNISCCRDTAHCGS